MNLGNVLKNIFNFDIFLALISGPIVSTLLMLIPLGVLIGLFEVIDPAFVAYEYVPEEILFIPWIITLIFISFVNLRSTYLLKSLDRPTSTYVIDTSLFYTPPEERYDVDEYPGKSICNEFKSYLLKILPDASCSVTSHKEYGWSFLVDTDINSIIEVSFSFAGIDELNPRVEKYEITIDYSPPLNPFYRISFSPNVSNYAKIDESLKSFMSKNGIPLGQE
jgi:hypothetical protein